MELNWESFINFPKDIEDVLTSSPNFFIESGVNCDIEDTIISPNDNVFIELEVEPINPFMYNYCLERGFGYQIYRNDKDINDHSIIRRKSFRCSLNGNYEGRKIINQNVHRLRNSNKTNCEWHCNFKLPKTEQRIRCTTLIDSHNHELNSTQIAHLNARYRQFNDDMMQDLAFFTDCKVASILHGNNKDENLDSGLLLNVLFEKITENSNWKVFVRHSGNERHLFGEAFPSFSKAFYLCRNTLSVELFEQHWKAKSYSPFQFNAGIQSTQSVKSFNGIIKRAVNSTSSLCDVEKAINKRHDDESQYCKLVDLKAQQTTVGLPHLASQFFFNIDAILNHFLTPLVLESDTVDNYFIEDVVDEPQIILQSFLNGIDSINIIETWRIRHVGGLSKRENLVILLDNGSHLCTCIAKFHINIIPNRWYKDSILTNLKGNVKNSPILTAIESNNHQEII
ncbi:unnamed protein product [Rhizophagus irregularis]|uniref:FAR1 domain-containing protein n=1 Tax=Rhizophagus irregularis TaxID=588596 RepID=A0A915ZV37_9GLOM|nr:unnamed protein product [Rhizophagus irregularis]